MRVSVKYTDPGCYIDGACGHTELRNRLASMVESCDAEVAQMLRGEMSDDAWEEDTALELLQEHTAEGLVWMFESGDLMLIETDTAD